MDRILEVLPSTEKGYLPYYLFLVSLQHGYIAPLASE
jgi:hypothetical protein